MQVLFIVADLLVAFLEKLRVFHDPFGHHVRLVQVADLHNQHILVIRPVIDGNLAAAGDMPVDAPQEVVGEFVRCRLLEAVHIHSLRVDAAHDMLDGRILAGRIPCLDQDDQAFLLVCIQFVLQGLDGELVDRGLLDDFLLDHFVFFGAGIHGAQIQFPGPVKCIFLEHGVCLRCLYCRGLKPFRTAA